jgi:hypothetical protein
LYSPAPKKHERDRNVPANCTKPLRAPVDCGDFLGGTAMTLTPEQIVVAIAFAAIVLTALKGAADCLKNGNDTPPLITLTLLMAVACVVVLWI